MEVKLKNVIFTNGFMTVMKELMQRKMTPATSYVLGKFADEVDKNAKIYGEAHSKVQKEFANLDKDGNPIRLPLCPKCGKLYKKSSKKKMCVAKVGNKTCGGLIIVDGGLDIPDKNKEKAKEAFASLGSVEETYSLLQKVKLDDDEKMTPNEVRLIGDILDLDVEEVK